MNTKKNTLILIAPFVVIILIGIYAIDITSKNKSDEETAVNNKELIKKIDLLQKEINKQKQKQQIDKSDIILNNKVDSLENLIKTALSKVESAKNNSSKRIKKPSVGNKKPQIIDNHNLDVKRVIKSDSLNKQDSANKPTNPKKEEKTEENTDTLNKKNGTNKPTVLAKEEKTKEEVKTENNNVDKSNITEKNKEITITGIPDKPDKKIILRSEPRNESRNVKSLEVNSLCILLSQTSILDSIKYEKKDRSFDTVNDYWYYVVYENKYYGWVFGFYTSKRLKK